MTIFDGCGPEYVIENCSKSSVIFNPGGGSVIVLSLGNGFPG